MTTNLILFVIAPAFSWLALDHAYHRQFWHAALFALASVALLAQNQPAILPSVIVALSLVLLRLSVGRIAHVARKYYTSKRLGQTA